MQMMLSQLLPDLALSGDIAVSGITDDSRLVQEGDLFLAVSGERFDAREYIGEVAGHSAAAIICEAPFEEGVIAGVPIFELDGLAERRGEIASRFFGDPSDSMTVIAVTGTNGKTSCSQFIASAMSDLGKCCGVIGTMGYGVNGKFENPGLTTPDAISIQKALHSLLNASAEAVSLEASSHGLDQGRLDAVHVDIAVFTNITRDHLDYHESFARYKEAKQKLFRFDGLDAAVINLDDEFSDQLVEALASDIHLLTYSIEKTSASIWCRELRYTSRGFEAVVDTPWGDVNISSSLLGHFNVSNLLAVTAVLGHKGFKANEMSVCISTLGNILGRMDMRFVEGQTLVVIDFAHTPDALEKAIEAIRVHCNRDIWCVMGCGGNRDKGKRPQMGEVSTRLADHTIVTDDNPRDEDPAEIIKDILAGTHSQSHVVVESNRKVAIRYALSNAANDDVVLIAGKGHEDYQEIGGKKIAYSDYVEVEEFFK